MRDIKVR